MAHRAPSTTSQRRRFLHAVCRTGTPFSGIRVPPLPQRVCDACLTLGYTALSFSCLQHLSSAVLRGLHLGAVGLRFCDFVCPSIAFQCNVRCFVTSQNALICVLVPMGIVSSVAPGLRRNAAGALPWMHPQDSPETRTDKLMAHMSMDDKLQLLAGVDSDTYTGAMRPRSVKRGRVDWMGHDLLRNSQLMGLCVNGAFCLNSAPSGFLVRRLRPPGSRDPALWSRSPRRRALRLLHPGCPRHGRNQWGV